MTNQLRGVFRLLFFAFAVSWLIVRIVALSLLKGENPTRSIRMRQRWSRWFLPAIGVRIRTQGAPPNLPCIVMCNHRSYLDPVVLVCDVFGMPVSKAEVAGWPVIGYGARVSGTLFLRRESHTSRKMVLSAIAEKVREGFPVILFPEGTTHDKPHTTPLKRGGFQLAAEHGIPIVPAAIEYGSTADYWIGNDTFLPHFIRRFGQKNMQVAIRYGDPLYSDDPQFLLAETQKWMDAQIAEMRREFF